MFKNLLRPGDFVIAEIPPESVVTAPVADHAIVTSPIPTMDLAEAIVRKAEAEAARELEAKPAEHSPVKPIKIAAELPRITDTQYVENDIVYVYGERKIFQRTKDAWLDLPAAKPAERSPESHSLPVHLL